MKSGGVITSYWSDTNSPLRRSYYDVMRSGEISASCAFSQIVVEYWGEFSYDGGKSNRWFICFGEGSNIDAVFRFSIGRNW